AGQKLPCVVKIAERPGDPERFADRVSPERNTVARLGVLALDLDDEMMALLPTLRARAGVVVATADRRGTTDPLMPGDVIYSVNQERVAGIEKLQEALARLKPTDPIVLQVEREGELRYVTVEPD